MEICIKRDSMEWKEGKVKGFFGQDLLSEKNGSVKLVKVEANASYPVHQHPDKTEYVFVVEGFPSIIINNEKQIGEKGDFFTLPKGIMHSIENNSEKECVLLVGSVEVP